MKQLKLPAVFMRGGTSNAVVFNQKDLPQDRALWDEIFLAAIGSPDPNGRQLDGMGGGVSSLSKVCVVGPSTRPDADIDYTFAQVQVKEAKVDYGANCGNMSSAMGPFALDEGMVKVSGREALVRIHNTNTKKIIHALFSVDDGLAAVDGDLAIPGVSGTGSPVKLEFRDPGGATTGKLLPTGNVVDTLDVPGIGKIRVSMVDAANATVWVKAADIGLTGIELPEPLEANTVAMQKLSAIRIAASVAMGIAPNVEEAAKRKSVPFIGFVSAPQDAKLLSGETIKADEIEKDLRENDEAIGSPDAVERFVVEGLRTIFGVQIDREKSGYLLYTFNLPPSAKSLLPSGSILKVSFESPTPENHIYIGRNHPLVEQLCQIVLAHSISRDKFKAARASVLRTAAVKTTTTLLMFRCRNVIEELKPSGHQLVAEEMLLWGYRGTPGDESYLPSQEAKELLAIAQASGDIAPERSARLVNEAIASLPQLRPAFDKLAEERCQHLVEAHERFSSLVEKKRFGVVYPVLPMDVLGVYILLPAT